MLPSFITTLLAVASTATAAVLPRQGGGAAVRVVSFNIRYDANKGQRENDLEKRWAERGPVLIKTLNDIAGSPAVGGAPTIFGLQEVLDNQLFDIKNGLGADWDHVGVARDDGAKEGEYGPILYKPSELKLLSSEVKWLTPTPDEVSQAPGAGSKRIVTIAVFQHVATGKTFIHANTHLDNVSAQARIDGAKVVLDRIAKMRAANGGDATAVSLTGDFNSGPGTGDAYQVLTDSGTFKDLHDVATADGKLTGANQLTYTRFQTGPAVSRIDFIWLSPIAAYSVQKYEIWNNVVDGTFISDHRPVVGDVTIN